MTRLADLHQEAVEDERETEFLEVLGMKVKPSLKEVAATQHTLVSLAAEAADIAKAIMEAEGELTPEIEERLAVNEQMLLQKADNYNFIIDHLEASGALWKRRKDACAAIEKRFKRNVDSLWERIKLAMKSMGKDEVKGNLYRFKLSTSAPKLVIEDESLVPEQFKMVVQSTVVDTEKVKAALRDGFEVPGAKLEENGTLRVYDNSEE